MKKFAALFFLSGLLLTACQKDLTYQPFAQCLEEEEAIFYGAFWCPNCNNQKELFKGAADDLPYIECAQGGKDAQVQLCLDEGVTSYPTWKFADGSILNGTQTLETLSEYSGCLLPGEVQSIMLQADEETEENSPEETLD